MRSKGNSSTAHGQDFLKKLIDLVLYSNVFIGLGAACMGLQTFILFGKDAELSPLIWLIFFSTLVIYALHRVVGLPKVADFLDIERYKVIFERKNHIWLYAILAIAGGVYCFFKLSFNVRLVLVLPAVISLLYVLPVLGGKKALRLRDFDMIKIFLIALVWAYVTVVLPAVDLKNLTSPATWLMFLERALFVFAITLPFDIRDLNVDRHVKVNTIPARIGIKKTIWLALACLGVFCLLAVINYGFKTSIPLFISAISTGFFIGFASPARHDYYFSGLLDGTMIIQFLLVYGASYIYLTG